MRTIGLASAEERALQAATWTLAGAVALGSFWSAYVFTSLSWLTVGRTALLVAGSLCLIPLARRLRWRRKPPWTVMALAGLLGAAIGLILISASGAGCFCGGAVHGFVEVAGTAVLVAVLTSLHPPARGMLLMALAVGVTLAAGLALAGVTDVRSAVTAGVEPIGDRLRGPYGNPNLLGVALACGAPVLVVPGLAQRSRGSMLAFGLAGALVATALVLSYSRGGIIAAAAGIATGIAMHGVLAKVPRRYVIAGVVAAVALAAVSIPVFNDARTRADFGLNDPGNSLDSSGWDGRAQGPIPEGPSLLENDRPGVLSIVSNRAGEGASFPLGAPAEGSVLSITFRASARASYLPISYALQDNLRVLRTAQESAALARAERSFSLRWRVPRGVNNARFYVWQRAGASTIDLLSLRRRIGLAPSASVPLALQGEVDGDGVDFEAAEERFIQSRIDAADSAAHAFASAPLEGIGWQRFPGYAQDEIGYRISTHNEYLRFAAELGAPGLLVLGLLVWTLLLSTRKLEQRTEKAAVTGGLVAGAVALLFVNALALPIAGLPLAVLAGVSTGSRSWT